MNQAGTYNAHLTKAVLSKTKNSGSLQAALVFQITHMQNGHDWQDINPLERTVFLSFSGKAKDYTKKKLLSLGFGDPPAIEKDPETGEQLFTLPPSSGDEAVQLICKHESYNGETKERWDLASWGGGVTGEAADDEDALKLAALW